MQAIKKRGRTWTSVISPRSFTPFSNISTKKDFDRVWETTPEAICAHISHAAYHEKSYLVELFIKFGAKIHFYESKPSGKGILMGRQAFMAVWPNKAILAFRGTEVDEHIKIEINKKNKILRWLRKKFPRLFKIPFVSGDLLDDLNAMPIAYKEGTIKAKVHKGFYQATQALGPQIADDIKQVKAENKPIYVTGHSLGGAMAIIAAAKEDFTKVFTFGMPAAGDNLDKVIPASCQHLRYVNGNDPIPRIVPKFLFQHHGKKIKIQDIDGDNIKYDHSIINYALILTS